MKIQKLKFKNFMSYGNVWTEINFSNNSLNLLTGLNGSGKTSILFCLIFGLTGRAISNRTLDTLVNRRNKNLEVILEVENRSSNYKIIRNLKPSKFQVYCDGILIEETDKLNLQKYVNENILGNISLEMLQNLLFINVSSYKSLFQMKNKERMQFFFDLLEISSFDRILEFINSDLLDLSNEIDTLTIERYKLETRLNSLNDFINLEEGSQRDDKTSEIVTLTEKLLKLKTDLSNKRDEEKNLNILEKFNDFENKLKLLDNIISEIGTNKLNLKTKKVSLEKDRNSFLKQIKLLESGKCNVCESDLTSDFHLGRIDELKVLVSKSLEEESSIDISLDEYETKLKKVLKQQNKINKEMKSLNELETKFKMDINILVNEISNIELLLQSNEETLKNQKGDSFEKIEKLKSEYVDVSKDLTVILDRLDILKKETDELNVMYGLFDKNSYSDKNLVNYIIGIFLNVVQNEVNDLLMQFDKNFKISLDSKLNISILSSDFETDYSINNLSSGEKRFLEICFLIVLVSVLKEQSKQLNTVFLDEIFTTLDNDTLLSILEVLKLVSINKNINIFVIHHGILDDSIFDNIYLVEKLNGYSQLKLL